MSSVPTFKVKLLNAVQLDCSIFDIIRVVQTSYFNGGQQIHLRVQVIFGAHWSKISGTQYETETRLMFLEILSLILALFIYSLEAHSVSSFAYQKLKINVKFEAQNSSELHANFGFHLTKNTFCFHYHEQPINLQAPEFSFKFQHTLYLKCE